MNKGETSMAKQWSKNQVEVNWRAVYIWQMEEQGLPNINSRKIEKTNSSKIHKVHLCTASEGWILCGVHIATMCKVPWFTYLGKNLCIQAQEVLANDEQVKLRLYFHAYCWKTEKIPRREQTLKAMKVSVLTDQACLCYRYLIRNFTNLKAARDDLNAKEKNKPSPESFNLMIHTSENEKDK